MKLQGLYIESRFGRRIVALFLLAAVLPVTVLLALGWQAWTARTQAVAEEQLQRDTKYTGMQVYDRLIRARDALQAALDQETPLDDALRDRLQSLGMATVIETVPDTTIARPGEEPSARQLRAWWHNGAKHAVRLQLMDTDGPARLPAVVLAVQRPDGRRALIARVSRSALWADTFVWGANQEGCVYDANGRTLFCNSPLLEAGRQVEDGETVVKSSWNLFLDYEFDAPDWRFETRRLMAADQVAGGLSLAGLAWRVALAVVLVAATLSIVLVRRTVEPLRRLTEVARQLSNDELTVRADPHGSDEFAELGDALNGMAEKLIQRGDIDSLTQLFNREGLGHWMRRTPLPPRYAMMLIDLDHFSEVNDTLGHDAGDEVLKNAAEALTAKLPKGAVAARQGGDEFVLLVPAPDDDAWRRVAEQVRDDMARRFVVRGNEVQLGASIGVALHPDHGGTQIDLLRYADMAMYAAKAAGRGQYALFDTTLERDARDRATLTAELRSAVPRDELVLYFQPRIGCRNGRARSAEALVRWQHPERGMLGPGAFIGLAEQVGLIPELGRWVLRDACRQMAVWLRRGVALERVSVNVSVLQLREPNFVQMVLRAAEDHGLEPHHLELELTESLMAEDPVGVGNILRELHDRGIHIALDDFGTGFSSMAYLRQLPLSVLKIDRAFVKDLGDGRADDIARSIIALGQALKLEIVAEGVETQEQHERLCGWGVDEIQGFLHAKPMPAAQLEAWLAARAAAAPAPPSALPAPV